MKMRDLLRNYVEMGKQITSLAVQVECPRFLRLPRLAYSIGSTGVSIKYSRFREAQRVVEVLLHVRGYLGHVG